MGDFLLHSKSYHQPKTEIHQLTQQFIPKSSEKDRKYILQLSALVHIKAMLLSCGNQITKLYLLAYWPNIG